jgi:hypothetical protein
MRLLILLPALILGCKKTHATVSGKVDGQGLDAISAFWGGPYLVIADAEFDCIDMPWVLEEYDDDEANEVSTDTSFRALQFTYESSEVEEGKLSIRTREAPAYAWFLDVADGEAAANQATSGTLELEFDKKDRASGDFDLTFGDDGTLKGDFLIEKCTNLKKRKWE